MRRIGPADSRLALRSPLPMAARFAVPPPAFGLLATLLLATPALAAALLPAPGPAQEPPARVTFALDPDTVGVGEPFTLGILVRSEPGWRVQFPEVLRLPEGFEQRAAAETLEEGPAGWRAYYRLVAWEAPATDLPSIEIELFGDGEARTIAVEPPAVRVRSVLPENEANLELRPARPLLDPPGSLWLPLLVAALALALAVAAWWWRRRRSVVHATEARASEAPAERALRELAELRARWEQGAIDPAAFYDGLEGALRGYAEATRGWPPGTLIGALPNGDRELAGVLRRSAFSRFGRIEVERGAPVEAIEVCRGWLEARAGADPESAAEAEAG